MNTVQNGAVEHAMDGMMNQAEILEAAKAKAAERKAQIAAELQAEEAVRLAREARQEVRRAEEQRRNEARKERVVRKEDIKRMAPSIRTLLRSGWHIHIEEPEFEGDKFFWKVTVPGISTVSCGIAKDRTAALRRARRAMKKHYMADTKACRHVALVARAEEDGK